MFPSAETPQALLIPELLRRIFELSTQSTNVSNACVCRLWNEEAMSVNWRDVGTSCVFALLSPLHGMVSCLSEH